MLPERPTSPHGRLRSWLRFWGLGLFLSLALAPPSETPGAVRSLESAPPKPLREFRGAWIATVANLDWPSRPGLSTAEQKAELVAIMEKAAEVNLNVLLLQVRPACDAFYASELEPWSEFLTGQMGKGPEPFYDPLAFAIEEAHRRGLELHAWFNPFRVRAPVLKGGVAGNYVTRTRPEFVRTYGSQLWMDPGLKAVHDYSIRVILDVVRRYNIDGVHLDDYFYPYPERNAAGQNIDFPDGPSWKLYTAAGGRLNRADWRRKNVDDFVHALNQKIKAEKKWVKFGISPFGIWQPGFPKQVTRGLNAYDYLYADSRKWLANGWADYFVPQLYWAIDGDQSFPALLHWWSSQNSKSRLLCAGNDATKVGTAWTSTEIVKQIRITQKQAGAAGNVLWNMTSLLQNNAGLADSLRKGPFASPAVVPVCSWLNPGAPAKPILKPEADQPRLSWRDPGEKEIWLWVYQTQRGGKWATTIFPGHKTSISLPKEGSATRPDVVAVTALNRYGAAGPTSVLDLRKATPPSRTDRASSP